MSECPDPISQTCVQREHTCSFWNRKSTPPDWDPSITSSLFQNSSPPVRFLDSDKSSCRPLGQLISFSDKRMPNNWEVTVLCLGCGEVEAVIPVRFPAVPLSWLRHSFRNGNDQRVTPWIHFPGIRGSSPSTSFLTIHLSLRTLRLSRPSRECARGIPASWRSSPPLSLKVSDAVVELFTIVVEPVLTVRGTVSCDH